MKIINLIVLPAIFLVLAIIMIGSVLKSNFSSQLFSAPVKIIFDEQKIYNLSPKTEVIFDVDVQGGSYPAILFKTVFTEISLYADDILIYEYGKNGSIPSWFKDPPRHTQMIILPQDAHTLRFEYKSPSHSPMIASSVKAGSEGALLMDFFIQNEVNFILSILFLLLGFAIFVISLFFLRRNKTFLLLSLFALVIGCWGFGECDLAIMIFPYPALLYIITYIGYFSITIPLLQYGLYIIRPRNTLPMRFAIIITCLFVCLAFTLHLFRLVTFKNLLPASHIILPLGIAVFVFTIAWEYIRYKNRNAKNFILPVLIVIATTTVELINFNLNFTGSGQFTIFGAFVFTILLGVIGVQNLISLQNENKVFQITNAELNEKVHYDALTGIYNRRYLDDNLGRIVRSLSRSGGFLTVMFLDIDFFKKYNDTYGHDAGDVCLKTVANALSASSKRADDFVARYSGEEFVAVFPNTDVSGSDINGNRLLETIRNLRIPHKNSDISEYITISIGAATVKVQHDDNYIEYIKSADEALYISKNNGRNRYTHIHTVT